MQRFHKEMLQFFKNPILQKTNCYRKRLAQNSSLTDMLAWCLNQVKYLILNFKISEGFSEKQSFLIHII